ncbi:MAG: EAL domain-containing protein [Lachnospiraceae bacterium]|nr:EAL domain-containing protein [Lachnospiraceae bacterium]
MISKGLVYTNENCVGCNKCITACSCIGACVPVEDPQSGKFRIEVDGERCIACGACFDACVHNAREYTDDTDAFFEALERGEEFSMLIAPSFPANYPDEYEAVLGELSALGVNRFINIAFGADIATWCYVNYMQQNDFVGGISQPCPAVVSYIEKYEPKLINRLFPIQSPLMCAAIYARKHLKIKDKLAFLSPCIAKKTEINDPNTHGLISYNVTFSHLMKKMRGKALNKKQSFDRLEYGLGGIWPMPGGLKENIAWLLGEDVFIRQVEGEKHLYNYLKHNAEKISDGSTGFSLIDVLNCKNGCLCGTAAEPEIAENEDPLIWLLKARSSIKSSPVDKAWRSELSPKKRLEALNKRYKYLKLSDFERKYTDKSSHVPVRYPDEDELKDVFADMRKYTHETQHINCTACGNETCYDMAVSIFNGFNNKHNCVYYVKNIVDEEEAKLRFLAEHDQSLLIYNRRAITEKLESDFSDNDTFSVILADLNNFKGINATYGNNGGDMILRNISSALENLCSKKNWICGRFGGDEFMIIIPGSNILPNDPAIEELITAFSTPTPLGGEWISATVSIGISNSDGVTPVKEHIASAENAMYIAKSKGKNCVIEYSAEQKAKQKEENEIKAKVLYALENDGFFMVYQPQVDAATRSVNGYEALVRMKTPGVYPGQFIPIAEKNGWIWRIGRITTELVVKQLAEWIGKGYTPHPVSINFSSNQLSDESYVDFLEDLLKTYNIPSSLVEIEITEGLFLEKSSQAQDLFDRFKKLGIRLLMDDFGTGYSSLGYLTYIPVDVIKLDKSLVDTYLVEGKDSFIHNVIRLMHDLDKEMLIEGVEEKWQYDRLREMGADTIQGYYFSKPIPPEEAIIFNIRSK